MGTRITNEQPTYSALNNCAFVSTLASDVEGFIKAFAFLMDSSMLGVGVGFDTKGKDTYKLYQPLQDDKEIFVIPDTREGWVESIERLL